MMQLKTLSIKVAKYAIAIVLFVPAIIILFPIEFPVWKEYQKQGYNVPGYLKFFWYRSMILKEVPYHK